jgi:hypothetical protein
MLVEDAGAVACSLEVEVCRRGRDLLDRDAESFVDEQAAAMQTLTTSTTKHLR